MEFVLGNLIWIYPHEDLSWVPGEIIQIEKDAYITVAKDHDDSSLYRIEKINAYPVHPSCLESIPDLLSLGEFNEGALLHNIRTRYLKSQIYTSIGKPILISINPYAKLPIYSEKFSSSYREKSKQNVEPHLFLMAEQAYAALSEGNQSIIISGESGSGKTEAAKIILNYLAGSVSNASINLSKQVLDTNPILEAFGNSKTLRNDNSSRFGKFIEIHFDNVNLKLQSARIQTYLLEKSRIVNQQDGERNYHFFYQICAGASDEERERYSIGSASDYYYLNKGGCIEIEGIDDGYNYSETRECMNGLGFTALEQESITSIVMGILHLGNLNFIGDELAIISNTDTLELVSALFGLDSEDMKKILTTRVIIDPSNGKEIIMPQSVSQSYYTRDAIAKAIYSNLFSWLVDRINRAIFIKQKSKTRVIGLLDIYGFEVFDENSFEQFCINYANEKLQQHFNNHMFKLEQLEYTKEKIKWDHIEYEDNQMCIDLIEQKPIGIISLLDENCRLQKATDKQFLTGLYNKISNPKLCNPGPFINEYFGVSHYAGDVFYNINGFIEKNKDALNPMLHKTIQKSSIAILLDMFPAKSPKEQAGPGSISAVTLGTQFKNQLHELLKVLSGSTPSFVRCIKPNSSKSPLLFDSIDVQRQLRCAGMLECIRIRKAGYSVRRSLKEFTSKYWVIVPSSKNEASSTMSQCKDLLTGLMKLESLRTLMDYNKKLFQMGVSMVFMKDELRQALDIEYSKAIYNHTVLIQKIFKGRLQYNRYQRLKRAGLKIQKFVKNWIWKKRVYKKKNELNQIFKIFVDRVCVQQRRKAFFIANQWIRSLVCKGKVLGIGNYTEGSSAGLRIPVEIHSEVYKEEEKNAPKSKSKKYSNNNDLTSNSNVIATLQQEIKSLGYYLTREREKNKTLNEELQFYKKNYQLALTQLESVQSESKNFIVNLNTNPKDSKNKQTEQSLQREIHAKTNQIELLNLKIQDLNTQMQELEESNEQLKKKESNWRNKLESEMVSHNKEIQDLRNTIESLETIKKDFFESRSNKSAAKAYENEIYSLKKTIKDLEGRNQDLCDTEAGLKTVIKSLQDEISSRNKKKIKPDEDPKLNTQELEKIIENQRDQNEELQEELEKIKTEAYRMSSMENYYKEEISKHQKLNKEKQKTIKDLEKQIEDLQTQKILLAKSKFESESPIKNSKSSDERNLIGSLKEDIQEKDLEIQRITKEINSAKKIYGTLLTILKFKNTEINFYKQPDRHASDFNRELNNIKTQEKELLGM
jgi:myosin V